MNREERIKHDEEFIEFWDGWDRFKALWELLCASPLGLAVFVAIDIALVIFFWQL